MIFGLRCSRIYVERTQPDGVIVVSVVAVSNAPSEGPCELQLLGGTEVHLKETEGEWVHLDLPGEARDGWMPLDALEWVFTRLTLT